MQPCWRSVAQCAAAAEWVSTCPEKERGASGRDDDRRWAVGEDPADEAQLKSLLAPYPSDEMICWPVSTRVGNVKNNDPNLIEPVAALG
jgi:hypothetical protein